MIALTTKAAKRWKLKCAALSAVEAGAWVVDLLELDRGLLLVMIVHQDTLFTLLRPASEVKSLARVAEEISRVRPGEPVDPASVCRNGNRRVTGTITDMKRMIRVWVRHWELSVVEEKINDTPFSAIGMDLPRERFARPLEEGGGEMSRKKIKLKSTKGGRKGIDFGILLDGRAMERAHRGIAGGLDPSDPRDAAQEIIYDAFERRDVVERVRLARKALETYPDCVDGLVLLAEAAKDPGEKIAILERAVTAGEHELGPQCFEKDVGHFWGPLETRPYMRARQALAGALRAQGRLEEAADHLREMLRLNPNDNQGVRTVLLALLIELGRDDEATRLYEQYAGDSFAGIAYCRALLAFRREGDTADSRRLLAAAVKANRFVPDYLAGTKRMPRELPNFMRFGDDSEAIAASFEVAAAWRATPGALGWLASRG
jgi:hypothetical protein